MSAWSSEPTVAAREGALAGLLDAVVASQLDVWLRCPTPVSDASYDDGLRVLALALLREWDAALAWSAEAAPPTDDDARWLRSGAVAWAAAGDESAQSEAALAPLSAGDLPDTGRPLGRFAGYLMVEAALAHARLDLALEIAERLGERVWDDLVLEGVLHAFSPIVGVCRARLLTFRGEVADADRMLGTLAGSALPTVARRAGSDRRPGARQRCRPGRGTAARPARRRPGARAVRLPGRRRPPARGLRADRRRRRAGRAQPGTAGCGGV